MPIHPIGEKNRKGSLGSPYSVKDYRAVNPEFGTLGGPEGVRRRRPRPGHARHPRLGRQPQRLGQSAHDAHPDWYEHDWKGDFRPTPWWDWSDIIDFDYSKTGLRRYMADVDDLLGARRRVSTASAPTSRAMCRSTSGRRCAADLDAIKPVFMLGEWEMRDLHMRAFDASYAWEWNRAMADIAAGKADVGALFGYYCGNESAWPSGAMRMTYIANHDQNAWEGTEFERFGPALHNAIVLSFVGEGIPLIYNGQEAGNAKRLKFFEKDPIRVARRIRTASCSSG